jgi:hypothetical protein
MSFSFLKKVVGVIVFASIFFLGGGVNAVGEDCCALYREGFSTQCRVARTCNTNPIFEDLPVAVSERGNPGVTCRSENDGQARQMFCTRRTAIVERLVSCTSEPSCAQALSSEDNCSLLSEESCKSGAQNNRCFYHEGTCFSRTDLSVCRRLPRNLCGPGTDGISVEGSAVCRWLNNSEGGSCVQATEAAAAGRFAGTKSDILPDCAIQGTCRSLKDLEAVAFRIVNVLFTIMGSVSFAFFIYGGIVMIASFGNSEQFGKGKSILVAAIVGIIISFSAYLLVGYLFDLLGIPGLFRGGINVGS